MRVPAQHPHIYAPNPHLSSKNSPYSPHHAGEMVLLLHWSLINHAAVLKILKKHDKRTGGLLKTALHAKVLQLVSHELSWYRWSAASCELTVAIRGLGRAGGRRAGQVAASRSSTAITLTQNPPNAPHPLITQNPHILHSRILVAL